MRLICGFRCSCVIHEVIRSLNIYYRTYRHCVMFGEVWRSNVKEHPWRSKGLPWNDLVSKYVSSSYMLFILDEIQVRCTKLMFGLETYGQTFPMTIQGSLRKDPSLCVGLLRTSHTTEAIDAQWVSRRLGRVSFFGTYSWSIRDWCWVSEPIDGRTVRSTCGQMVRRLPTVDGSVSCV